jgi:hypothetical protein
MAITAIPSTGTLRPASYLKLILQRTECFAKKTLGATCAEAEWLAKSDDVLFMNDVAIRLAED